MKRRKKQRPPRSDRKSRESIHSLANRQRVESKVAIANRKSVMRSSNRKWRVHLLLLSVALLWLPNVQLSFCDSDNSNQPAGSEPNKLAIDSPLARELADYNGESLSAATSSTSNRVNRTNHDRQQRDTWPTLGATNDTLQVQSAHLGQTVELRCHLFGRQTNANERPPVARSQVESIVESMLPSSSDDLVTLILWYKDDNPSAIYTLDARQVSQPTNVMMTSKPKDKRPHNDSTSTATFSQQLNRHLVTKAKLYSTLSQSKQTRLQLDQTSDFPVIKLIVKSAEAQDSGQYKCRVDFRRSPSQIQSFYLQVLAPVERLEVFGSQAGGRLLITSSEEEEPKQNKPIQLRVSEDELAEFTCLAHGGSPGPQIDWLVAWRRQPNDQWTEWKPLEVSGGGETKTNGLQAAQLSPLSSAVSQRLPELGILSGSGSGQFNGQNGSDESRVSANVGQDEVEEEEEEEQQTGAWSVLKFRLVNWSADEASDRLRLKCRARPAQFGGGQQPEVGPTESAPSANSRDANWVLRPSAARVAGAINGSKPADNMIEDQRRVSAAASRRGDVTRVALATEDRGVGAAGNNELLANGLSGWFEVIPNFKPKTIEISALKYDKQLRPLPSRSDYKLYELELSEQDENINLICRSSGSRPAATFSWKWDWPQKNLLADDKRDSMVGADIQGRRVDATGGANDATGSSSLFELRRAEWRHHRAELVCQATNELMPAEHPARKLEARVRFLIKFGPKVKLVATTTSDSTTRETQQQQLKCLIESNPPINQLVWLVNGRPLAKMAEPLGGGGGGSSEELAVGYAAGSSDSDGNQVDDNSATSAPPATLQLAQQSAQLAASATKSNDSSASSSTPMAPATSGATLISLEERLKLWPVSPLISSAIDESKYKFSGNRMTVINLTKLDERDEYQCRARNSLAEATSKTKVRLTIDYRPSCSLLSTEEQQQQQQQQQINTNSTTRSLQLPASDLLAGLFDLSGDNESAQQAAGSFVFVRPEVNSELTCPLEAHPQVEKYHWSYVTLEEFVGSLVSEFWAAKRQLRSESGKRRREQNDNEDNEDANADYSVDSAARRRVNVSKQTDYATTTTNLTTTSSSSSSINGRDTGAGEVGASRSTNEPEGRRKTAASRKSLRNFASVNLRNKLNELSSRVHLTTSSARVRLGELISGGETETAESSGGGAKDIDVARVGGHSNGLVVLCRGSNRVGWQLTPCVSILTGKGLGGERKQNVNSAPSAGQTEEPKEAEMQRELEARVSSCRLRPTIRPQTSAQVQQPQQQQQQQAEGSMELRLECGAGNASSPLGGGGGQRRGLTLFQLAASKRRRDEPTLGREDKSGAANGNAAAADQRQQAEESMLLMLFTADQLIAGGDLRFQVSELVDLLALEREQDLEDERESKLGRQDDQPEAETETKQRRKSPSWTASGMTLKEQGELLNEFVFTLRGFGFGVGGEASASRAIYGSEVKLEDLIESDEPTSLRKGVASSSSSPSSQSSLISTRNNQVGAAQVSRSTQAETGETDEELVPVVATGGTGGWNLSSFSLQRSRAGESGGSAGSGSLSVWARQHEVGITLAAMAGTLVLSALTVTLIVLVIKVHGRRRRRFEELASDNFAPCNLSLGERANCAKMRSRNGEQQRKQVKLVDAIDDNLATTKLTSELSACEKNYVTSRDKSSVVELISVAPASRLTAATTTTTTSNMMDRETLQFEADFWAPPAISYHSGGCAQAHYSNNQANNMDINFELDVESQISATGNSLVSSGNNNNNNNNNNNPNNSASYTLNDYQNQGFLLQHQDTIDYLSHQSSPCDELSAQSSLCYLHHHQQQQQQQQQHNLMTNSSGSGGYCGSSSCTTTTTTTGGGGGGLQMSCATPNVTNSTANSTSNTNLATAALTTDCEQRQLLWVLRMPSDRTSERVQER